MSLWHRKQAPANHVTAEYDRSSVIRRLDDFVFRLADATSGVIVFGATGSGKTSGPARFLAHGYLASNFGGLVLCAKPEERRQWQQWAADTHRTDDLVIVDKAGAHRFNFMHWEQARPGVGGGLTINIVALLGEIANAVAGSDGQQGGESQFWGDALKHLMTNTVDLCLFAGDAISLPLMRDLVMSAPQSLDETANESWQEKSACWSAMRRAHLRKEHMDAAELADFTECVTYWTREYPTISFKTRSIVTLMFSLLTRPFTTRPLRRLFCEDTTITPEDAFDGKIIIIDLPVQDFRLAGRVAALAWKTCFQNAVMRRAAAPPGQNLRPVFLWSDEYQNFVTERDAEYQAVARSAAGCTVALTQNRESLRRVLGKDDTVDALLGNLQSKWFCQNSGETNEYAARLLGERWKDITHSGVSYGSKGDGGGHVETAEQRRYFVEPSCFATLRRGGAVNNNEVETIVYNGGWQYALPDPKTGQIEQVPYKLLTIRQGG